MNWAQTTLVILFTGLLLIILLTTIITKLKTKYEQIRGIFKK